MKFPTNKFTLSALLWFAASVYSLLFREADGSVPPFAHFDKVAHAALFFAQFWLCAKAFRAENRPIPYRTLLISALIFAIASEWAQAAWTQTREGSIADGAADMFGACAALWLAKKTDKAV